MMPLFGKRKKWSPDSNLKSIAANDPSLYKVDWVDWAGKDFGDDEVIKLIEALRDNIHVKELRLSSNKISNVGVKALAEMLQQNTHITHIYLGGYKICDVSVKFMAAMLQTSATITDLCLSSNNITDVSAKALAEVLLTNITVTRLDLYGRNISADLLQKVYQLAKINEASSSPDDARRRKEAEFGRPPRKAAEVTTSSSNALSEWLQREEEKRQVGPHLGGTATRVNSQKRATRVSTEGQRHHHMEKEIRERAAIGSGQGGDVVNSMSVVGDIFVSDYHRYEQEQGDRGRELAQDLQREEEWCSLSEGKIRSLDHTFSLESPPLQNDSGQIQGLQPSKVKGLNLHLGKESRKHDSAVDIGREIMRVAIETPNVEPVKIPLEYIKESTADFLDKRRLGEGSFSWVFVGKDKDLRHKFAVKRLRVQCHTDVAKARETFEREVAAMKYFRHPNIARLYAYHLDSDCACLLYELASRGSLDQVIADEVQRKQLHWTKRISVAVDIAKALEYMHGGTVDQICFHRDVKASNVCLKRNFTALLIDCGVAKITPAVDAAATMTLMETTGNGMRGTPGYICPDYSNRFMQGGSYKYSSANDVFSLGVVMTEIFTGVLQNSLKNGENINMYQRYIEHRRNMQKDVDKSAKNWNSLAKKNFPKLAVECMSRKPEERPTIDKIVERLGKLDSKARPHFPGEQNSITVLVSSPLVYFEDGGENPMIDALNFGLERDLLEACIKESKRDIRLSFDTATIDRLQIAATKRCGCLHFSGHGFPDKLVFENGRGAVYGLNKQSIKDYVHQEPFTLVFISACYSGYMGAAFVDAGVKHVVCCKYDEKINDDAAIKFTHHFYMALAEGYTVENAFEKGKGAARKYCVEEANKFLLLPHDGNHDVQVLHAEALEWAVGTSPAISIPPVPEHFLGREVDMYRVLQLVLDHRLVNLVGDHGIGCSSLASAVSHYINERRSTILTIKSIYYLRGQDQYSVMLKQLHGQLANEGLTKCSPSDDDSLLAAGVVSALSRVKALVVFDDITVEDSVLISFIECLLEKTLIRLLILTRKEVKITSLYAEWQVYKLGQLNVAPTVTLFGKACQHVDKHAKDDILLERVASNNALFKKIGGGIPAQILKAAKHFQKEEYENLFLAQKPHP